MGEWVIKMLRAYKPLTSLYLMPVCIVLLAALDVFGAFAPASRWLYDHASHVAYQYSWGKQAEKAGVYDKHPVLIAIDEASLQAIGRWPWSRNIHAQLLNTLNQPGYSPSVVAMDVVFAEPQVEGVVSLGTDEDAALAKAINQSQSTVLLATQLETIDNQTKLIQPREPLSLTRARVAHVQIDADVDGSVRRYWPFDRVFVGLNLPYLGKAMLTPSSAPKINTSQLMLPSATVGNETGNQTELLYPLPMHWVKEVSYQAVLLGEIKKEVWAGAPVLVAATARGLGDQYVSHVYSPSTVVAGGEVVLAAFHTEKLLQAGLPKLRNATTVIQWASVLMLMGVVFFGLRRSSNVSRQLAVVLASLLIAGVMVLIVLIIQGVWLNAALLGFAILFTWVVWVSHTLRRLLGFLLHRVQQSHELQSNPGVILDAKVQGNSINKIRTIHAGLDLIDEQLLTADVLESLRKAELSRLRGVLEMLPDAAFVLTISSLDSTQVSLNVQNRAARQLSQKFPQMQAAVTQPLLSLNGLLAEFNADLTEHQQDAIAGSLKTPFQWQHLFELRTSIAFEHGVESNAPQNGRFLIKLAYLSDMDMQESSLTVVLSMVDLSVGLALDEARNRTLNFLSHDLRAPQATILALIELEAEVSPENAELFSKIQFQSERTLQLAEGFVQLSQASHSAAYNMVEYNLSNLVVEALDEQWATAKQKGVVLKGGDQNEDLWVELDRNLMWRALVNLINNALSACKNTGQLDGEVCLSVRRDGLFGVIEVRDNGPGIPLERQAILFQPFVQGHGLKRTGAGLGLAFVKTVLDQHSGQVRVVSPIIELPQPHGTVFELWLPLLVD
jgi:signal transduction histidine kinase/CHASE2 domain-containing sensor protein